MPEVFFCSRSEHELHTLSETVSLKHLFLRRALATLNLFVGALKIARERGVNNKILLNVRIPTIATTRSDASRPPVPNDRDQHGAGYESAVRCIC